MIGISIVGAVNVHHLPLDISIRDRAAYVASLGSPAHSARSVHGTQGAASGVRVIDCTLQYIVDRICEDIRFAHDADRIRAYVDLYGNCCTRGNVWRVSMLPLTRAALNHIISCENASIACQKQGPCAMAATTADAAAAVAASAAEAADVYATILVVSNYLVPDIDASYEIGAVLAECFAFMEIGAPCRGTGECARGGTQLTPEGFASVIKSMDGPGWRACEIPPGSRICTMVFKVIDAAHAEAHVFRGSSGEAMALVTTAATSDNAAATRKCWRFVRAEGAPPAVPGRVSLFECAFDALAGTASLLDCAVCNGISVRALPLCKRIELASREISGWAPMAAAVTAAGACSATIGVQPALTMAGAATARRVLFARNADPYDLRCGGSAFLWKQPTLDASAYQAVLTCRCGEAMAVETYKSCRLSPVGRCCVGSSSSGCVNASSSSANALPKHMGCYVCTPDLEANSWIIVREAKRSERLYTLEEAAACIRGEPVTTQITRAGMMRLLRQITGADAPPTAATAIAAAAATATAAAAPTGPSAKLPGTDRTVASGGGQRIRRGPEGSVARDKASTGTAVAACAVPRKKTALTKRAPQPPFKPAAMSNAFGALDVDEGGH